MNKKFLIAWLVMFVVYMAGGFVVHGTLLKEDYMGLPTCSAAKRNRCRIFT